MLELRLYRLPHQRPVSRAVHRRAPLRVLQPPWSRVPPLQNAPAVSDRHRRAVGAHARHAALHVVQRPRAAADDAAGGGDDVDDEEARRPDTTGEPTITLYTGPMMILAPPNGVLTLTLPTNSPPTLRTHYAASYFDIIDSVIFLSSEVTGKVWQAPEVVSCKITISVSVIESRSNQGEPSPLVLLLSFFFFCQ
jgi:hypothetical protein